MEYRIVPTLGLIWSVAPLALLLACEAPSPCQAGVTTNTAGECAVQWSCVDAVQRIVCTEDEAGSVECICYLDGAVQVEDDGAPARHFDEMRSAAAVCSDTDINLRSLADRGCGWNLDGH